jgi:hypothetical protein
MSSPVSKAYMYYGTFGVTASEGFNSFSNEGMGETSPDENFSALAFRPMTSTEKNAEHLKWINVYKPLLDAHERLMEQEP